MLILMSLVCSGSDNTGWIDCNTYADTLRTFYHHRRPTCHMQFILPAAPPAKQSEVETYENLTDSQICDLFYTKYREQIFSTALSASMHRPPDKWLFVNHATLIRITDVVKFKEPYPLPFNKKRQQAWIVLDAPLHVCEICHDSYFWRSLSL